MLYNLATIVNLSLVEHVLNDFNVLTSVPKLGSGLVCTGRRSSELDISGTSVTSVIFSSSGTDAGVVTGSSGTSSALDLKHDASTCGDNTDGYWV